MNRTRIEQETTITFNAEEPDAIIWSAYPKTITKLTKLGFEPYQRSGEGRWFKIPKQLVSFRSKKAPRSLTDEQRKAIGERFKKSRE